MMSLVTERESPDEVFGALVLIQKIQERWSPKLRHRIRPRNVSATLLSGPSWARSASSGTAYYESLYKKR